MEICDSPTWFIFIIVSCSESLEVYERERFLTMSNAGFIVVNSRIGEAFVLNAAEEYGRVSVFGSSGGTILSSALEEARALDKGNVGPLKSTLDLSEAISLCSDLTTFVSSLSKPRKIFFFFQETCNVNGDSNVNSRMRLLKNPTEGSDESGNIFLMDVVAQMDDNDFLIDCASYNHYSDCISRLEYLNHHASSKAIRFVSLSLLGGAIAARRGPSMMVSGDRMDFSTLEPMLTKCAGNMFEGLHNDEDDSGSSCISYIGPLGSGHFLKSIISALEIVEIQLISEVFDLLTQFTHMEIPEISNLFNSWSEEGLFSSTILGIISAVLLETFEGESEFKSKSNDSLGGVRNEQYPKGHLVNYVLDSISSAGTHFSNSRSALASVVHEAINFSISAPTFSSTLDAISMSFSKDIRNLQSSKSALLTGPLEIPHVESAQVVQDIKNSILASRIMIYNQGLTLFAAVSQEMNWNSDLSDPNVSRCLKGGCLIASPALNMCLSSLGNANVISKPVESLSKVDGETSAEGSGSSSSPPFLTPSYLNISYELSHRQNSWRRIVTLVSAVGISCPVISSALVYYDSMRRRRIPSLALLSLTANYLEEGSVNVDIEVQHQSDEHKYNIRQINPRWTVQQKNAARGLGLV